MSWATTKPLGVSPKDDIQFLVTYAKLQRMHPQFHQTLVHFAIFVESLFSHLYGGSEDAVDLLNVASSLMRTVFKEAGDPDAAFHAIAMMVEGRDATSNPLQRAVFGLNICQNVYSPLARGQRKALSIRLGFDLKDYGVSMGRETLREFEAIDEPHLYQLRANQKWILGDILKSDAPTDTELEEAIHWLNAALSDPGLSPEIADFVRESLLSAKNKRQNLSPQEQSSIRADPQRHREGKARQECRYAEDIVIEQHPSQPD